MSVGGAGVPSTADVVVIGGGPAGHAAALAARRRGASVVLVERELLGGHCVHHTCVPNALLLGAAGQYLDAQELGVAGVFEVGESFDLGRAVSRRGSLVATLARGVETSLRAAGVTVTCAAASIRAPGQVSLDGGAATIAAGATVIASGSRWEPPRLPGVPDRLVITLDEVTRLTSAPRCALVLGGGPADTSFALEAAVVLAAAGTAVTFAAPGPRLAPALDADMDGALRAGLESLGITVLLSAATTTSVPGGAAPDGAAPDGAVAVDHERGSVVVAADVVVSPDLRTPNLAGLGLETLGVDCATWLAVDDGCRTAVAGTFAAGDVTGGAMLSTVASHMGRVAGINAAGGRARTRLDHVPHVLHTTPPAGWVGLSERTATAQGYDVVSTVVDLRWSARSVTLGGREGYLKLVAERELGQVLGVQVVAAEAAELVALAAQALQTGLTVDDLAEAVHWHPSAAESLGEAARDLVVAAAVVAV